MWFIWLLWRNAIHVDASLEGQADGALKVVRMRIGDVSSAAYLAGHYRPDIAQAPCSALAAPSHHLLVCFAFPANSFTAQWRGCCNVYDLNVCTRLLAASCRATTLHYVI